MNGGKKMGMLEIIFGGLLVSSLVDELAKERDTIDHRVIEYKAPSEEIEKNTNDENFLSKEGMKRWNYNKDLYEYIQLESEDEIIKLIERKYKDDYLFMDEIGDRLYDLELYKAAEAAYRVVVDNKESIRDTLKVLNAYKRIGEDKGLKDWRDILSKEGENTWWVDRYLKDEDPEGLKIKIRKSEELEDWQGVINYCNKYNKLILLHPWETMDKRVEYEFKKLDAYINLKQYKGAWNSICKTRGILLSNFGELEHLNYLGRVEFYMKKICIYKNYPIDSLYHHIMELVYRDIFHYYDSDRELSFKLDTSLKEILKECHREKIWAEIERVITYEYGNISEKTIRRINNKLNNIIGENNYKYSLDEPKKYYPKLVARDFPVK